MTTCRYIFFIVLCLYISSFTAEIYSQTASFEEKLKDEKSAELKVAPYINYSQTIGGGFGLIPMLSFPTNEVDSISPKSVLGASGFVTTNKSKAVMAFGKLFFDEDKWRLTFAAGLTDFNFQTYVELPFEQLPGYYIPYSSNIKFASVNLKRKINNNLYGGLGYISQKYETQFFNNPLFTDTTNLNTLQVDFLSDSRDSIFYPRRGSKILARVNTNPTWMGNVNSSNSLYMNWNQYIGVKDDRDVVAARFHSRAGLGDISFQQQAVIGGVDLRGYSKGKYRGKGVLDVQAEYRWNPPNKFDLSAVGFAGIATLYGATNESFNWKAYPSIGTGIRWTALRSSHFNVGMDAAVGKDDWGVYFRLNEAF